MAMRLEKFLDRRLDLRADEVRLSDKARERVYQRSKGPAPVPSGKITMNGKHYGPGFAERHYVSTYAVQLEVEKGDLSPVLIMSDDEVDKNLAVVDARLLGKPGVRYDHVFNELRSEGVSNRYNRVHNLAGSLRRIGGLSVAALAGTIWAIAHGPTPIFVDRDSCADPVGADLSSGQYIERLAPDQPQADGQHCTLAGQEYIIRDIEPQP